MSSVHKKRLHEIIPHIYELHNPERCIRRLYKYEKIITLLEKLDGNDINYVEAMIEGIVAKSQNPKIQPTAEITRNV